MGEVLRGYDDRLDRPVALKRLVPGSADPEHARQRFRREARMAARLNDSGIVQVYDWEETEDGDWLVMELVDGRTLAEILADGLPELTQALWIAREVASGLAAAHDLGLVHRDLKPANVMLVEGEGTAPDRVKILDFGIAKPLAMQGGVPFSTLTAEGHVVGAVSAMSPEQALGQTVDHRSDLFALGSLLYEMLSGESPFEGPNNVATLSRICSSKQTALCRLDLDIPEGISEFVDRLLAKEPARRPAEARQVMAELERLLETPTDEHESEDSSDTASQTTLIAEAVRPSTESEEAVFADPEIERNGRKISRGWLAVAVALFAAALWSLWSWWGPPGEDAADAGAASTATAPQTELDSPGLFQRGMALLERYDRKGNIEEAIVDFQRALVLDESSAPALAGLARGYWLDSFFGSLDPQRVEQAIAAARQAVELDEYLAIARVSLGLAYFQAGRAEEAANQLEHALQLEPKNADAYYGLSLLYDSQSKFSQAEEKLQKAITLRPNGWEYLSLLGQIYGKTGRPEAAEEAFRQSLELTPDNFLGFRNLGAALYMQGKLPEAASQFQQALQIRSDASLYANLGTIYFAQGLYPQAVSAFKKAMETGGSNNFLMWGNLGDAYRWTPDNETHAQEAFLRAVQLLQERLDATPEDVALRTRLALNLAKLGNCEQVAAEVTSLGELPAAEARSWYRLAVANEICDKRDKALSALGMALQAGFSTKEARIDPELLELRQDVRYHRLEMSLRSTAAGR